MTNRSPRRLPEEIYVRRRVAAAVIILVLVGLLVWGFVAFAGRGADETGTDTAAAASSAQVTTSTVASTSTTTTTAESSAKETPSEEPEEPKESCQLSDLRITASSDRPSYGADVQPTFYMTVANPTKVDCEINLDDNQLRF